MNTLAQRLHSWQQYDEGGGTGTAHRAVLSHKPAPNPEHLTRPVKIKRIGRGFIANGRAVVMGEIRESELCVCQRVNACRKGCEYTRIEDRRVLQLDVFCASFDGAPLLPANPLTRPGPYQLHNHHEPDHYQPDQVLGLGHAGLLNAAARDEDETAG